MDSGSKEVELYTISALSVMRTVGSDLLISVLRSFDRTQLQTIIMSEKFV